MFEGTHGEPTILLNEDDPSARKMYKQMLHRFEGFTQEITGNPKERLECTCIFSSH